MIVALTTYCSDCPASQFDLSSILDELLIRLFSQTVNINSG
jgi:hypothetical protein